MGQVYNNAKAALDRNPLNAEAMKMVKVAEPKIFSGTGGKAKTSAKPSSAEKTVSKNDTDSHDLNF